MSQHIKTIEKLNKIYQPLEYKRVELFTALYHRTFELETGWYNGHYRKSGKSKWVMDYYPIPVITVEELCDIEINFENITISTKLSRAKALVYDFAKFDGYDFEAYGVDDYLADYHHQGISLDDFKKNITNSTEKEIGFSFVFPFDTDGDKIFDFVKFLRSEHFYS